MTDATEAATDKIRCDACPVMCYIRPGAAGACDRYANHNGELVRVDPHIVLERTVSHGGRLVPFQAGGDWDGRIVHEPSLFVTAIGAGTTYPDYKPAPFIVSSEIDGVDMVTVVTEGIFSYCGVKVKIDTDRYLGPETATVRAQGEAIGHVTTSEYGSQMLSLGGVHHLTGGSKKEGRVTCDALMDLSNCKPVELTIDGGATVVVQAGYPPIVNGVAEERSWIDRPDMALLELLVNVPETVTVSPGLRWLAGRSRLSIVLRSHLTCVSQVRFDGVSCTL